MRNSLFVLFLAIAAALAACGNPEAPSTTAAPADGLRDVIDAAATKSPPADAPLQPGQTVQGTIGADVGRGMQSFRSLATKVADDIGQQMDARLDTGAGRKALDDANRKLDKLGTGTRIDAGDVRDFVGGMAGKVFHDSDVRNLAIISSLQVSLSGKAADGGKLEIALSFDDKNLKLSRASLSYRPDARAMFEFHETEKDAQPQVAIERFEKNADGSYAISGSFSATNVPASKLAKKLKGTTLPQIEGRFDFAALPLKEMPKIGG